MRYPAIIFLMLVLGACAARQPEPAGQADLRTRYVYTLERHARHGFKSIHWVTVPSNAQVARRLGSTEDEN